MRVVTKRKDKEKAQAIKMRLAGASYSQIKKKVNVSKGTLSTWLREHPLSEDRIREIRNNNPRRIERFRNTMRRKREAKQKLAYNRTRKDIGDLNRRDIFIAGLFLYWGEGSKSQDAEVSISNTDPAALRFFIRWLGDMGVHKKNLRVRVHLYSDMIVEDELKFWSMELKLPLRSFRKPYIKTSRRDDITWKHPAEHGTCNVIFYNKPLYDYVMMGLKRIKELSS